MRADATSLPTVGDDERHLCVARSGNAVVPADTDDVVSDEREQRLTVVMVDMGEVHDLAYMPAPGGARRTEAASFRR